MRRMSEERRIVANLMYTGRARMVGPKFHTSLSFNVAFVPYDKMSAKRALPKKSIHIRV